MRNQVTAVFQELVSVLVPGRLWYDQIVMTMSRDIVKALPLHVSDFDFGSYTSSCAQMCAFVPNKRHLKKVLIFFPH